MDIEELTQQSTLPAYVELFDIDCTGISGLNTIFRFTPNVSVLSVTDLNLTDETSAVFSAEVTGTLNIEGTTGIVYNPVVFGGNLYTPFPIEIKGYSQSADAAPARPTLSLANVNKVFGMLSFQYGDLIGAKVTYYRTFQDYLNLPTAKSAAPLKFTIARKSVHNMNIISYELRSPLDKERAKLPKRQMLKRDFPGLGLNKVF